MERAYCAVYAATRSRTWSRRASALKRWSRRHPLATARRRRSPARAVAACCRPHEMPCEQPRSPAAAPSRCYALLRASASALLPCRASRARSSSPRVAEVAAVDRARHVRLLMAQEITCLLPVLARDEAHEPLDCRWRSAAWSGWRRIRLRRGAVVTTCQDATARLRSATGGGAMFGGADGRVHRRREATIRPPSVSPRPARRFALAAGLEHRHRLVVTPNQEEISAVRPSPSAAMAWPRADRRGDCSGKGRRPRRSCRDSAGCRP